MSEDSIFNQPAATTQSSEDNHSSSVIPQELQDLVGDGKKYHSVEDALKSVPHAQSHIKKLEDELGTV